MGLIKLRSAFASRSSRDRAKDRPANDDASADAARAWRTLVDAGRLPEALAAIDRRIGEDGGDAELLVRRADVLRTWGRDHEAARSIAAAATLGDPAAIDRWRGWASLTFGRADEAVACFARARECDDSTELARDLAQALVAAGRFDDASELYGELHARSPADATVLREWGVAELRAKRFARAVELFERVVVARPEDGEAHEHLGVALSSMDRTAEAVAALQRSVSLSAREPGAGAAFSNLAIGHAELGEWSDTLRVLVDALREVPDLAGHLQLSVALLALGRFTDGWRQYEHRWLVEPLLSIRARYGVPQWTGQPLDGRTVLVRSEQGLGDVFQFVRYVPLLKAHGARVVFQPLAGMDVIARRFPGVDQIVGDGERLPPIDYFVNLMSLPRAFGTTVDTIPSDIPYLSPDPAYFRKWRARFANRSRPVVGLAWAGRPQHRTDRHRSLTVRQLAPLFDVPDVRFVSLQKGPAAVQAETVSDAVDWEGVGAELDDLEDAAAVVAELDLLVCVDTGLAHLAAAMGKPVWVMLPEPADYRWLTGRDDTPWYPTMRLFRQATPRDWRPVVERVASELASWRASWQPPASDDVGIRVRQEVGRRAVAAREDAAPLAGLADVAEMRAGLLRFMPDDAPIGRALAYAGEWLPEGLEILGRFVRPGMTLVEAGADVGALTVPLARMIGHDGTLLAYEDRPMQRRLLADNLKLHGLPHASVMLRRLGAPTPNGFTSDRETIDDLGLARLDGLKLGLRVDVPDILAGATDTLWRCRPWIMAELVGEDALAPTCDVLRAHGYRWWRADLPIVRPDNFNRRTVDAFGAATIATLFAAAEEWDVGAAPDAWREATA
jgi:tetratricopeptide (TPR) repeat protein